MPSTITIEERLAALETATKQQYSDGVKEQVASENAWILLTATIVFLMQCGQLS